MGSDLEKNEPKHLLGASRSAVRTDHVIRWTRRRSEAAQTIKDSRLQTGSSSSERLQDSLIPHPASRLPGRMATPASASSQDVPCRRRGALRPVTPEIQDRCCSHIVIHREA
ncbi:unnamed protein product [Pleuronectes platessa]|uniref:Uncharacterized protein n=1 Tax=Pleuronectes platessa TaxID=8262 RepID=A0A9N7ZAZ2_PLEPL|nr:unnamed protein product [Pleuronectes platessa]